MDSFAGAFAAVAGLIAALFSVLNFFLGAKQENQRWKREALLDTFAEYMSLSQKRDHLADLIARLRQSQDGGSPEEILRDELMLHERQIGSLTRLRLLADRDVVAKAEMLHLADHELIDAALAITGAGDVSKFVRQRAAHRESKVDLFNAMRKSMHLSKDAAIHPEM
jgi:hypothetical protein